jgi:hypothetical protein
MRVAESRVYDLDVISGVEVAFLHVVADPDAIFERVLARFAEHSDEIRAINIALAVERLEDLLANEHGCSPQGRLWTLRACAHLACALRIYRDTDLLMPKMRHFAELLPRDTYQRLREIQGIDDVMPSVPDLLEHTRSIAPRMTAQLRALPRRPTPIATPRNALLKLAEGSIDDGVLLLRAFFERSFIDQVVAALPDISIVQFLLETCDPNIRTYWQALHGLAASNDMVARTAEATSRSVHALVNELEIELASAATC